MQAENLPIRKIGAVAAGVIMDAAQVVLARRRMTWGQQADE